MSNIKVQMPNECQISKPQCLAGKWPDKPHVAGGVKGHNDIFHYREASPFGRKASHLSFGFDLTFEF